MFVYLYNSQVTNADSNEDARKSRCLGYQGRAESKRRNPHRPRVDTFLQLDEFETQL